MDQAFTGDNERINMEAKTMGDRGNIIVKDGDSTVYLYTHWSGSRLNETLKQALIRGKDKLCQIKAGKVKVKTENGNN